MKKWLFYKSFSESLRMAEYLLSIDVATNHDPPIGKNEVKSVEALRGAAAIICVATFEAYLRAVFEGYIDDLVSRKVQFRKLPEKFQTTGLYGALEYCIKPPKSKPMPSKQFDRIVDVLAIINNIGKGGIESWVFSQTNSNPSSEQVKSMFSNIGLTDFYGNTKTYFEKVWGLSVADMFIKDKLDEIVQRRHTVAHTASALNISRGQLRESFKFLRALSKCVEHTLYIRTEVIAKMAV